MEQITIIDIVSSIVAVVSLGISMYGFWHNRFLAVNEFLSKIESNELIAARKYVYNTDVFDKNDEQAAIIVNFFHHWGLLVKKHFLPMWVFDDATGFGACRLYRRLETYIALRQEINVDKSYGEYFKWLYDKLIKRQKRRQKKCVKAKHNCDDNRTA